MIKLKTTETVEESEIKVNEEKEEKLVKIELSNDERELLANLFHSVKITQLQIDIDKEEIIFGIIDKEGEYAIAISIKQESDFTKQVIFTDRELKRFLSLLRKLKENIVITIHFNDRITKCILLESLANPFMQYTFKLTPTEIKELKYTLKSKLDSIPLQCKIIFSNKFELNSLRQTFHQLKEIYEEHTNLRLKLDSKSLQIKDLSSSNLSSSNLSSLEYFLSRYDIEVTFGENSDSAESFFSLDHLFNVFCFNINKDFERFNGSKLELEFGDERPLRVKFDFESLVITQLLAPLGD